MSEKIEITGIPVELRSTPAQDVVVHTFNQPLIDSDNVPFDRERVQASAELNHHFGKVALKGEYRGGDLNRIAARSGVPVEEVNQAAAESVRRQREALGE